MNDLQITSHSDEKEPGRCRNRGTDRIGALVIKRQGCRRQDAPCSHPLAGGRLECSESRRGHRRFLELNIEDGDSGPQSIRNQMSRSLGRSQAPCRAHGPDQDQCGYRGDINRLGVYRPGSWSVLMDLAALGIPDDRPGLCRFDRRRDDASGAETSDIQSYGILSRWIPPEEDAEIVRMMEDVIYTYLCIISSDPRNPVILIDEESSQDFGEVRKRETARSGESAPLEYEYERKGDCRRFVMCEPLRVRRIVTVIQRRTRKDFPHLIHDMIVRNFSRAEKVLSAKDNLEANVGASRYADCPPGEARRTFDRIDYRDSPKHECRRNMAVKEIGIPVRVFIRSSDAEPSQDGRAGCAPSEESPHSQHTDQQHLHSVRISSETLQTLLVNRSLTPNAYHYIHL